MMQLLKETQEYMVSTEKEASDLIESIKKGQGAGGYELVKSSTSMKTKKSKGEIIDLWYVVSVTKKMAVEE